MDTAADDSLAVMAETEAEAETATEAEVEARSEEVSVAEAVLLVEGLLHGTFMSEYAVL